MGLREQATLDARAILEDTSGFAWPVELTSPLGAATSLLGFTTDVGQTIDPETGQAVSGRRASCSLPRAALSALPEAVAESSRKPWLVAFNDSRGAYGQWKVIEVLPDAALGVVVLLLEEYKRAIVQLAAAALALPAGLQLSGEVTPAVELAGALALPAGLQGSGEVTPAVELAGALALPMLQLSGTITPEVELAGALALPMLQLSGEVTPEVSLAGSLALPMIQLSGSLTVDANALAALLDLRTATITGSGYSSVPDLFNGSNPAVQNTDSQRPPNLDSANGLPRADFDGSADCLSWPAASNNNQTVTWGVGFWVEPDVVSATQGVFCAIPGASNRVEILRSSASLIVDVYHSQTVSRRATVTSFFTAGGKRFVTLEYNGAGATDADKCTITSDGVVQSPSFSNALGTPGAMPATLVSLSGSYVIGARAASPVSPFNGKWGPLLYVWGSKQSGATEGLLTAAARAASMAYLQPT